jgi:hypothetical protein
MRPAPLILAILAIMAILAIPQFAFIRVNSRLKRFCLIHQRKSAANSVLQEHYHGTQHSRVFALYCLRTMKIWVAITDFSWFSHLAELKPDEVNFWQPAGGRAFHVLQPGEPLLFYGRMSTRFSTAATSRSRRNTRSK